MKQKQFVAFVLSLMLLVGCSSEQSRPDSSSPAKPNVETSKNEDRFPLPANLATSLQVSERPASIDAFRTEFVRRFQTDLYAPFIDLAYWDTADDNAKKVYLEGVKATFTMPMQSNRATIRKPDDIEIQTIAEYGESAYYPSEGDDTIKLNPPPSHVIGITGHFSDTMRVTNYFAVGTKDGRYYFCTIVKQ